MKKLMNGMGNLPYKILAAATVSLAATEAMAEGAGGGDGKSVGAIAEGLVGQMGNIGRLVVGGAFVGGLVMLGTGLMKLKAAAEDPRSTKYSEGLWRVGVGAALVAIPAFTGVLSQTFGLGEVKITAGGGASF